MSFWSAIGGVVKAVVTSPVTLVKDVGKVATTGLKGMWDGAGLVVDLATGNKTAAKNKLIDLANDGKAQLNNLKNVVNNPLLLPLAFVPGVNAVYGWSALALNIAAPVANAIPIPAKSGAPSTAGASAVDPSQTAGALTGADGGAGYSRSPTNALTGSSTFVGNNAGRLDDATDRAFGIGLGNHTGRYTGMATGAIPSGDAAYGTGGFSSVAGRMNIGMKSIDPSLGATGLTASVPSRAPMKLA